MMDRTKVVTFAGVFALVALAAVPASAQCDEVTHAMLESGPSQPRLTAPDGVGAVGTPFSVQVTNAPPFTLGVVLYGVNETVVVDPATQATLFLDTPFFLKLFATNGGGRSAKLLRASSVPMELCGATVLYQAVVIDEGAPGGFGVTNAVREGFGELTAAAYGPFDTPLPKSSGIGTADMDGDGVRDVVVMSPMSYAFLAGLPEGGLDDPSLVSITDSLPGDPALGDVDGDGAPDVAAPILGSSVVRVHLGVGDGSVVSGDSVGVGGATTAAVLADMDLDGALDLVVSRDTSSANAKLVLGNGDGTFGGGPFAPNLDVLVGARQLDVAVADMDEDGWPDVVVALEDLSSVTVARGLGGGTFAGPVHHGVHDTIVGHPEQVEVADVDGDGLLDVAALTFLQGSVSILTGFGDGTLASPKHRAVTEDPEHFLFPDIDGDGRRDIVTTHKDGLLSVRRGKNGTQFEPVELYVIDSERFSGTVTDVDVDGNEDLLLISQDREALTTVLADGAGGLYTPLLFDSTSDLERLTTADLDGDGFDDLFGWDDDQELFVAHFGSVAGPGPPVLIAPDPPTSASHALTLGDVTGDGIDDLVRDAFNSILVQPGLGGGLFGPAVPSTGDFDRAVVSDFDGDGHGDLVSARFTVQIRFGNPSAQFFGYIEVYTEPDDVAVGDVSGDGVPDIVSAGNGVFVIEGLGNGGIRDVVEVVPPAASDFLHGGAIDVNGDGLLDVVAYRGGFLTAVIADGAGGYSAPILSPAVGDVFEETHFGDFDGDGLGDVAVPRRNTPFPGVAIYSGASDGTFTETLVVPSGRTLLDSAIGDFDGDSLPDVAFVVPPFAPGVDPYPPLGVSLNLIGE